MTVLVGTEILEVQGIAADGSPAATTQTVTVKDIANTAVNVAPLAGGATKTLTAADAGLTVLLDTAAGSVITLPAATGSGNVFKFVTTTTTTSGAHKILAASTSDFLQGIVIGENLGTAKVFTADGTADHSLQMPFTGSQPSGGFIGDSFTITDIATNLFQVTGTYQAGTTPTTPFSTSAT